MSNLLHGWIDIEREKPPQDDRPKLVVLAEKRLGSTVHIMTNRRHENGNGVTLIGGHFAFDMPKVLYWKYADPPPDLD